MALSYSITPSPVHHPVEPHCTVVTLTDLIVTVPVPILDALLGALGVRMPLRLRRLELLLRWSRWSNSC